MGYSFMTTPALLGLDKRSLVIVRDVKIISWLALFLKFLITCFKFNFEEVNYSTALSFLKVAARVFRILSKRSSVEL